MPYIVVRSIPPGTIGPDGQPSRAGHSWIEIHGADGSLESFGYYPEPGSNPITGGPGEIRDTDSGKYTGLGNTSQPFSISEDQAQAVRDLKDQVNNGMYVLVPDLLGDGNNCASFVAEAMQVAGIQAILPFKNILPWWSTYLVDLGGELGEALIALNPELNSIFLAARGLLRLDPLAIDMDGDGIETVGTDAGVLFDHDGDGTRTGTGWVTGDDAFVVMDRDGNGLIDSGRELFGVDTVVGIDAQGNLVYATNGFDALSSLDGNGDSLFDANDADYANVRLWRDLNQDGISQTDELQSLADAGITAIDLAAQQARQALAGGNVQTLAAGVAGIAGSAVALDLASNPFYRDYPDSLDTTAVADLPDMQGAGSMRDLKEAATQSGALETQLRTIASQGYVNRTTFQQQVKALIDAWADTSAMQTWAQRQALAAQQSMSWNPNAGPATSLGVHTLANAGAIGMEIPYFNIHIIYQPQGVDRGLLEAENGQLAIGTGDGSSTGTIGTLPGDNLSEEEKAAQLARWQRANYLIETLERYNGMTFVNLEPDRVTDSGGRDITTRIVASSGVDTSSGGGLPGNIPVFIPLTNAQLEMLEQSYAALPRSVYDALAPQTRLKGYLDSIALAIDADGIKPDFAALDAMLAERTAIGAIVSKCKSRRWRNGARYARTTADDKCWIREWSCI